MRRSTAIFTLNRERIPLAFQAGHAGLIPVTRSTGFSLVQQAAKGEVSAPRCAELAEEAPVVSPNEFFHESTVIVEAENVHQIHDDASSRGLHGTGW
jgi:hypothetical protein